MANEEIGPLNKILINPFVMIDFKGAEDVVKYFQALDNKNMKAERSIIESGYVKGTNELCSLLVRSAAQKIYFSSHSRFDFLKIEDYLKIFPEGLRQRIELLDRNDQCLNRVKKYLEPIEIEGNSLKKTDIYPESFDFLYKILLASQVGAEVELSMLNFRRSIDEMIDLTRNDEVKFRLSEILGVYNIYGRSKKVQAIALQPNPVTPSIFERVDEMLKNDEIASLSKSRYYLGIPGKTKASFLSIQRKVKSILTNDKYSEQLKLASDIIQVAETTASGLPVPLSSSLELVKNLQFKAYNPPLIDLYSSKVEIARGAFGGCSKGIVAYMEATPLSTIMTITKCTPKDQPRGQSFGYHLPRS